MTGLRTILGRELVGQNFGVAHALFAHTSVLPWLGIHADGIVS